MSIAWTVQQENIQWTQTGETIVINVITPTASDGDMLKSVYDPNLVEGDAFDMDNMVESATAKIMTGTERTKLSGIETGAEANNISDEDAEDLTDSGDSTLHYHAADRSRANHTGTQAASTIESPVVYDASGDVSGGAVTLDYLKVSAKPTPAQHIDLGSATTLTFTAVNNLPYLDDGAGGSTAILTVGILTSGAGVTYTFPDGTLTSGSEPTAVGEHFIQFERTSAGVLMAFLLPTPTA